MRSLLLVLLFTLSAFALMAQGSCPGDCSCPGAQYPNCTIPPLNCPGDCGCPGNSGAGCAGPATSLAPRCPAQIKPEFVTEKIEAGFVPDSWPAAVLVVCLAAGVGLYRLGRRAVNPRTLLLFGLMAGLTVLNSPAFAGSQCTWGIVLCVSTQSGDGTCTNCGQCGQCGSYTCCVNASGCWDNSGVQTSSTTSVQCG